MKSETTSTMSVKNIKYSTFYENPSAYTTLNGGFHINVKQQRQFLGNGGTVFNSVASGRSLFLRG